MKKKKKKMSMDEQLKKLGEKNKPRTKAYTADHKKLFLAIFEGKADVNSDGKVVVGDKVWEWTDVDVQFFVKKVRQLKTEMTNFLTKELETMFGK